MSEELIDIIRAAGHALVRASDNFHRMVNALGRGIDARDRNALQLSNAVRAAGHEIGSAIRELAAAIRGPS